MSYLDRQTGTSLPERLQSTPLYAAMGRSVAIDMGIGSNNAARANGFREEEGVVTEGKGSPIAWNVNENRQNALLSR